MNRLMNEMDREFLRELMQTYGICGFTPQPASANLRAIAKIIAGRRSGRECIEVLIKYLRLNGISADGPRK